MFACLYSLSAPLASLVNVAQDFTPRFEIVGPLVMLDLSGLSRLFGSPREIGDQLRRSMGGAPVRIAIAPSQTAAALLALGRPGLTVVSLDQQPAALGALAVGLLGELEKLRRDRPATSVVTAVHARSTGVAPPHVGAMEDVLPYFQSCLDRTSAAARAPHANGGGGWSHPRDSHAAHYTKRARRAAPMPAAAEHPHTAADAQPKPAKVHAALKEMQLLLEVLRRWGVKTLAALSALPPGDVYERLGARGVTWQRLARGEDHGPLVPCVPEQPFEDTLELEWPIEGLEPLSFVLARLFEPLAERLERADRGAAILHTHLRLTTREVYARMVQLPAPMRDPKTLRTLVLLDLESNPPPAAIDRVRVLVEPTPARVLQWTLYERAQPSPEQVSTLLARLMALMGEGHVGSPQLVNSWKPGAFEMKAFAVRDQGSGIRDQGEIREQRSGRDQGAGRDQGSEACGVALRRFRLPIPARVQVHEGRPVRVMVDRRGITGGAVQQAAGPWRTSGEWWNDGQGGQPHQTWDRDEWDVLIAGGATYRLFVEREVGQWFIEGIVD